MNAIKVPMEQMNRIILAKVAKPSFSSLRFTHLERITCIVTPLIRPKAPNVIRLMGSVERIGQSFI